MLKFWSFLTQKVFVVHFFASNYFVDKNNTKAEEKTSCI